MENKPSEKKKGSGNLFSWLFWWQLDKDELNKQINEYTTLKITQSARGISLLCLLFSAAITTLFIIFLNWDSSAFFDVVLFLILGYFIYKGHRWAMIGAMLLWTFEKFYPLVNQSQASNSANSPFIALVWWATYMHAFYLAFQIERLRKKPDRVLNQTIKSRTESLDDLEKLAELKEKGIITKNDFNKKKQQILKL